MALENEIDGKKNEVSAFNKERQSLEKRIAKRRADLDKRVR